MKPMALRCRRGFGLVEVMVAVTIIMIVLGGTGALVNQSIVATSDAREKIIAEGLAQDLLEKARNNRDLNKNNLGDEGNGFSLQPQSVHNTVYRKNFYPARESGLLATRVTATITWPGRSGEQQTYTLTTILRDHE